MSDEQTVRVWDLFVRVCHWTVVLCFAVAYIVGDEILALHVWAGYVVGVLAVLRVLWGFVGPRHARFSDFVFPPATVFGYLRDLLRLRAPRYIGHSPAGGAMVVALLVGLLAITYTGLVTYAVRNNAGPLAGIVTADAAAPAGPSQVFIASARADDEATSAQRAARRNRPGRNWREAHELLANLVLVLVGLHIAGVLWSSFAHHENLVRAMVTGRKRADSGHR